MLLLSLESVFSGLAAETSFGNEAVRQWLQWKLAVMSLLPGTLLLFGLSYARGNGLSF